MHRSILIALFAALSLSSITPAFAEDVFSIGCSNYAKGNYALARAYFAKAVQEAPSYWPAHYQLANTYLKLEDYNRALTEYTVCLQLCPDLKTRSLCAHAMRQIESFRRGSSQVAMATRHRLNSSASSHSQQATTSTSEMKAEESKPQASAKSEEHGNQQ
ncbi:MAG TPA: tetratricopeptide repeat protein [Candidatus Obscuribacterales bacterium]